MLMTGMPPQAVRQDPSLLSMSFLKNFSDPLKRTTKNGQPQKRRGPKPDSKPALTRRQELNRQAQRTHRERKERYIRELELHISALREGYSNDITSANATIYQQHRALEELREENQVLRQILISHRIPFEAEVEQRKAALRADAPSSHPGSSFPPSAPQSVVFSGHSHPHGTPATSVSPGRSPGAYGPDVPDATASGTTAGPFPGGGSGYQVSEGAANDSSSKGGGTDAAGDAVGVFEADPQLKIDFILGLERSCFDHMERLCRRAHDDEDQETLAGHILMASCPPPSYIATAERGQPYHGFKTYDLPPANLDTLLNLSQQLVTQNEITPIMALQTLRRHAMYHLLTRDDIRRMMDDLVAKVRCYGFGAVLEDFELMDSLSRILASKMEQRPIAGADSKPTDAVDALQPGPPDILHPPRLIEDAMFS
ncbi:hypothetical protein VTO42DRAFT_4082 [Malbranchea cinnamomea]